MSVFTKEEIEKLLALAMKQNEELRKENDELLLVVQDATERIKTCNDLAEKYQSMFDQLINVIKAEYDAEFTAEDIPNRLS